MPQIERPAAAAAEPLDLLRSQLHLPLHLFRRAAAGVATGYTPPLRRRGGMHAHRAWRRQLEPQRVERAGQILGRHH